MMLFLLTKSQGQTSHGVQLQNSTRKLKICRNDNGLCFLLGWMFLNDLFYIKKIITKHKKQLYVFIGMLVQAVACAVTELSVHY